MSHINGTSINEVNTVLNVKRSLHQAPDLNLDNNSMERVVITLAYLWFKFVKQL